MRRSLQFLFALLVAFGALLPAAHAATCDVTWDAGGDRVNWTDPSNWTGDAVPGAADNVCLPELANTDEVQVGGPAVARSVSAVERLRVASDLRLAGTERSTVGKLVLGGSLSGPGDLDISSSLEFWGAIGGGVDVNALAGSTTALENGTIHEGGALHVNGSGTWNGAQSILGLLDLGGTVTMDEGSASGDERGLLRVRGTLTRIGRRATTSSITIPVENSGVIASDAGTLSLAGRDAILASTGRIGKPGATGGITLDGDLALGAGSVLSDGVAIVGRLVRTGKVTVSGDVILFGATWGAGDLDVTGTLRWAGGGFDGPGKFHVATGGKLVIGPQWGQGSGSVYLGTGAALENDGIVDWVSHSIRAHSSSTVINRATFKANAPSQELTIVDPNGPRPLLRNTATGVIVRDVDADTGTNVHLAVENLGTIRAATGRLRFYGGGSDVPSTGTFGDATDTGQIELHGEVKLGTGAKIARTDVIGLLDLAGDVSAGANTWQSGEVTGRGKLTITSDYHLVGYARFTGTGVVTVNAAATLSVTGPPCCNGIPSISRSITNAGTISWKEGTVLVADGVVITNDGTFIANAPGGVLGRGGASSDLPLLRNTASGTIVRQQGQDSDTSIGIPVENDGKLSALNGSLRLTGGGGDGLSNGAFGVAADAGWVDLNTGRFNIGTGATFGAFLTITPGGRVELSGTATATGLFDVHGSLGGAGRLDVSGTLRFFTGVMTGDGVTRILPAGKLELLGPQVCCSGVPTLDRTLRNEGAGRWDGTGLTLTPGAILENVGTFAMINPGTISRQGTTGESPAFINLGTVTHRRDVGGQTTIDVPFVNDGRLTLELGDLRTSAYTQTIQGTLASQVSGPIAFEDYGVLSAGSARLAGNVTFVAVGGYLPNAVVFTPLRWASRRGALATPTGFVAGTTFAESYRESQLDISATSPGAAGRRPTLSAEPAPPTGQTLAASTEVSRAVAAAATSPAAISRTVRVRAGRRGWIKLSAAIGGKLTGRETVTLRAKVRGVSVQRSKRRLTHPKIKAGTKLQVRLFIVDRTGAAREIALALVAR